MEQVLRFDRRKGEMWSIHEERIRHPQSGWLCHRPGPMYKLHVVDGAVFPAASLRSCVCSGVRL